MRLLRPSSLAAWLLSQALVALPAGAATTDRIALEQKSGETPTDVALAYLEACLRLGATPDNIRPLQAFQHAGKPFVRLGIDGPPQVQRCLNTLADRDAIDGTIHWIDGSSGGLLLSSMGHEHEVIIPDTEWYSVTGGEVVPPKVDEPFVDALLSGSGAAREQLRALPTDAAFAQLGALIGRGGPQAQAALEVIAATDLRWGIRRGALLALDPVISAQTILERSRQDQEWQVRVGAVDQVRQVALSASPRAADASALLLKIAMEDADWTVQRQALFSMPSNQVRSSGSALLKLVTNEQADSRVRAIALEVLGGVGKISRPELRKALQSKADEVRAVAAEVLLNEMKEEDAPVLWAALLDESRLVRVAAAPFLYRIDDRTIGPALWPLYLHEANLIDADPDFEQVLLEALVRAPYPGLSEAMWARLGNGGLSPEERRLLSRAAAQLDPSRATAVLEPDLASDDLLKRSIAADATPDTPTAHARRLQLLGDQDGRIRASALLGLCRASPTPLKEQMAAADLGNSPLEQEARDAALRCGEPESLPRFETHLNTPHGKAQKGTPSRWPALVGMLLLLMHVLATKITTGPTNGGSTAKPPPGDSAT